MPNLSDHIRVEIEKGNLNKKFSISSVTSLSRRGGSCVIAGELYEIKSVREILANHSIGPGDRKGQSVRMGQNALFFKHKEKATYSLIGEEFDGLENLRPVKEDSDTFYITESNSVEQIASDFVTYLREKPFRILKSGGSQIWLPSSHAAIGWVDRLNAYEWNGHDWKTTTVMVESFVQNLSGLYKNLSSEAITKSPAEAKAESIYNEVRTWGNPKGAKRTGDIVLSCLNDLWSGRIKEVDSTLTKLYAFAAPDTHVIYDSRVAAAIVSIAEDLYRYKSMNGNRKETVDERFHRHFPALGTFPGAGGTRPRGNRWTGWPNAYGSIAAQGDANRLCSTIKDCLNELNEGGRSNWTLREVEAVLFMEGY